MRGARSTGSMQKMARLSGAVVLLIVIVPLCMYSFALFVGIELGRALERSPDSVRGVVQQFAKELWDPSWRRGRGEYLVERHTDRALELARPARVARKRPEDDITTTYDSLPKIYPDIYSESSTIISSKPRPGSHSRNHTSPRGVIGLGPWGGSGGQPFYMRGRSPPRLRSIAVYHSSAIHSLSCEYDAAGDGTVRRYMAGPWGLPHSFGSTAVRAEIVLSAGERVTAVEGTIGRFGSVPDVVITSLTFRTSRGRTCGPYGGGRGTRFSVPVPSGCSVAGFWGRSGWLLDAIGVYIQPRPGVCRSSDTTPRT